LKQVFLLIGMTSLVHVTVGVNRLAVSLSAIHLGASPAVIGALMALFGIVSIFIAVPVGRWIDHHGPRLIMMAAPTAICLVSCLAWLWQGLPGLFVVALMTGTSWGMFYVSNQHTLGHTQDSAQRLRNFTYSGTAFGFTSFVAPMIGGFSIDHLGDANTFLAFAALPLISVVLVAVGWIPLAGPVRRAEPAARVVARRGAWTLLRLPGFRRVYTCTVLTQLVTYSFLFLVPIKGAHLGWSASSIGLLLGVYAIAMVAVRGVTGLLARCFTPWQMILAAVSAGGSAMVCVPLLSSFTLQLLCAACLGLSTGLTAPLLTSLLHDSAPQDRIGDIVGLRVSLLYTIQAIAPLVAGTIGALLSADHVFWAMSLPMAGAAWLAGSQLRRSAQSGARQS